MTELLWALPASAREIDPTPFLNANPDEVLCYYDAPLIFSTWIDGKLLLACWSDVDERVHRYLFIETTDLIVKALEAGEMTVRQAYEQPGPLLVADIPTYADVPLKVWALAGLYEVPEHVRPTVDSFLHISEVL
jgi:hypothetical protein